MTLREQSGRRSEETTETSGPDDRFFAPVSPSRPSADQSPAELFPRRLLPLLEKLAETIDKKNSPAGAAGGQGATQEVVSQLLAAVAKTAQTAQQLEERLDRLKSLGLETEVPKLLKTLGESVPDWAVVARAKPAASAGTETQPAPPTPVTYSDTRLQAMQRIVELGKAPEENAERFGHMVETAIDQFNRGSLGRAVSILESAQQLVLDGKVQAAKANPIWEKAQEKIRRFRFGECINDPVQHDLLRQFLVFFPAFSPRSLLKQLKTSSEKTGRRLLIGLLQTQGVEARSEILEQLQGELKSAKSGGAPDWDNVRDLLSLLTPSNESAAGDEEVELLSRLADLPLPFPPFRELVRIADQMPPESASGILSRLLAQAYILADVTPDIAAQAQRCALFEQILTRLARVDDSHFRRLVLEHCLDKAQLTGVSTAALATFGAIDLASDPGVASRLLAALQEQLPSRLIAWIRRPKDQPALDLVRALSGTSSPEVRQTLSAVARRFSNRAFGIAARQACGVAAAGAEKRREEEAPPEARVVTAGATLSPQALLRSDGVVMEGELSASGLPNLLQHFANAEATGVLELIATNGALHATAILLEGAILSCRLGRLESKEALYALLERPIVGRFRLVKPTTAQQVGVLGTDPRKPFPLVIVLLEGLRRYDEYRQSCLVAPDDIVLAPTGTRPSSPEDEDEEQFMREVWDKARSGKTALQCETEMPSDPYRVRRLLAHWVGEHSMKEVTPAAKS
jgi:hypothetical protein